VTSSRAARILETGLTAFAATTGAILVFGRGRGGALLPFVRVGRRVVREITLPPIGDATLGLLVHLGQSLALGAVVVLLAQTPRLASRVRAALVAVVLWQLSALIPWFSAIRADASLGLSTIARAGLALILVVALIVGSRGRAPETERVAPPLDN